MMAVKKMVKSDEDEEDGEEDDTINMSSSMLAGDSETSAMSEDASFQSSFSMTPGKRSLTTPKHDSNQMSSASPSVSGRSTPKGTVTDKPVGTGKKRGRPSKAVMKEREEAKRARGELPDELPKEKVPKKRGRKPK